MSANGNNRFLARTVGRSVLVGHVAVAAYVFVTGSDAVKAPAQAATPIGTNIVVTIDADGVITIDIDAGVEGKLSATGMSKVLAASRWGSRTSIPGTNIAIQVNAYRKVPGAIKQAPNPEKEKKEPARSVFLPEQRREGSPPGEGGDFGGRRDGGGRGGGGGYGGDLPRGGRQE